MKSLEITDKASAWNAVRENAQRMLMAETAAKIGTWEWDPAHGSQFLSPGLHRIFGTEAEDPDHAQKWADRVHAEDWSKVQQCMAEANGAGEMEFEYRYLHPHHGLRWFYCKGRRFGQETRMFGIVQDITARKQAEEALAASEERYRTVAETASDAIVSIDEDSTILFANSATVRVFGYKPEEIIGKKLTMLMPDSMRHLHDAGMQRYIGTGTRHLNWDATELPGLHKDGREIPLEISFGEYVKAGKHYFTGFARDITQQRRTEQALRVTERLASVGRLAATIAHEINNPLEAVTNLLYLARSADDPKEIQSLLSQAEEELNRVALICRQTLGFYRAKNGAKPLAIGNIVEGMVAAFAGKAKNKSIKLKSEICQDPEILAIESEIRQLVANLLSNSIEATPVGGRIRIRLSAGHAWDGEFSCGVRLTIADSGHGIAPEHRPMLFEPFFTANKDVGTGLGLWVSKGIVEKHGGKIRLKTWTIPGKSGTVFTMFLPSYAATLSIHP